MGVYIMTARNKLTRMSSEPDKKADRIIREYAKREYPPLTESNFKRWLLDERGEEDKDKALSTVWSSLAGMKASANAHAALKRTRARLGLPSHGCRIVKLRVAAAAAAIIIVAAVGGIWFISNDTTPGVGDKPVAEMLDIRELHAVDSVIQEKLSDDSRIWLKQNSSLTYRKTVEGAIYADLEGECFFDVQLEDSATFVVCTSTLQVRVHGTHFNVKESLDEHYTSVALYKGLVEVVIKDRSVFMEPGNLLTYMHDSGEVLYDLLPDNDGGWRYDMLAFDKVELHDILKRISDFYGITIEVAEGAYLYDRLSIQFDGNESAEELIFILSELSGNFSYEMNGDKVSIY